MMDHRSSSAHSARLRISFVALLLAGASTFVVLPAKAAQACVVPMDCPSGFCADGFCCNTACAGDCEACSAATKGSGVDGECGLAKEGTECKKGFCDGDTFSFIGPSKCDAAGACLAPERISCVGTNSCAFDLCGDTGCEHIVKLDGTECGAGMTCTGGVCGMGSSSSSSSSGSSSSSSSSSGTGGHGGAGSGGAGGSGEGGSGGQTDPYPPAHDEGTCACRAVGGGFSGTTAGLLTALGIVLGQLRRRNQARV